MKRSTLCHEGFAKGFCWKRDCPHAERKMSRTSTTAKRVQFQVCETKGCTSPGSLRINGHRFCSACVQRRESAA